MQPNSPTPHPLPTAPTSDGPRFTVWRAPKTRAWHYTIWSSNGRPLATSNAAYASRFSAQKGCQALLYALGLPYESLPILDGRSQ